MSTIRKFCTYIEYDFFLGDIAAKNHLVHQECYDILIILSYEIGNQSMSKSLHEKLAYRLADILTMLNTGESLSVDDLAQKYQSQSPNHHARY